MKCSALNDTISLAILSSIVNIYLVPLRRLLGPLGQFTALGPRDAKCIGRAK